MKKERLQEILKDLLDKYAWLHKMDMASAWVDDGKGGCINFEVEKAKLKAKVELLNQLISEYK